MPCECAPRVQALVTAIDSLVLQEGHGAADRAYLYESTHLAFAVCIGMASAYAARAAFSAGSSATRYGANQTRPYRAFGAWCQRYRWREVAGRVGNPLFVVNVVVATLALEQIRDRVNAIETIGHRRAKLSRELARCREDLLAASGFANDDGATL